MGVKFGVEEGTINCQCHPHFNGGDAAVFPFFRPLLHAKFHPHRCNDKGIGPPKLKFLLTFDQNVEYKRSAGAYPLRDFHKICRRCTPFQDVLAVKISVLFAQGLWSWGLTRMVIPKFSAPPDGETVSEPQTF